MIGEKMADKEAIRPIYSELQGYLSQAPEKPIYEIYNQKIWEQYGLNEIGL